MSFLEFILKVQQISKIGLMYSKDPYAIDNYEQLEALSREMLDEKCEDFKISKNIFERDLYPTPSSSVRVLVFNENNELLMVKEKEDGGWAIPGGWCEIFMDLKDNAIKECKEEANVDIELGRLVAIFRREYYKDYPAVCSEYVHYFVAKAISNDLKCNHETEDVRYFKIDALPKLSLKNTEKELMRALDIYLNHLDVYCD